jgi:hypothetical protein
VVLANGTMIATNAHLGLAGAGALALAANITAFTTRVDDLVSSTLYPAICAVQHRVPAVLLVAAAAIGLVPGAVPAVEHQALRFVDHSSYARWVLGSGRHIIWPAIKPSHVEAVDVLFATRC